MIQAIVNTPKVVEGAAELIPAALSQSLLEATALVTNSAINKAPRKFGTLKRSIHSEINGLSSTVIQENKVANYGRMVEEGTGIYHEPNPQSAYTIVPVNAKALKFKVNGKTIFSKKVTVKGMKARPYMKPAAQENKQKVLDIYAKNIMKALGVG